MNGSALKIVSAQEHTRLLKMEVEYNDVWYFYKLPGIRSTTWHTWPQHQMKDYVDESVPQRDPEGIVGLSLPGSTIRAPAEKESQSANLDFQVNAKTKFFNGKLDEVKTDDHYMKFEFGNHEIELKRMMTSTQSS